MRRGSTAEHHGSIRSCARHRTLLVCALLIPGYAVARASAEQDSLAVDENALFADTQSVVSAAGLVDSGAATGDMSERKSVGLSGEVTALAAGSLRRDWFLENQRRSDAVLAGQVVANLMLDARLPRGIKAFANAEANVSGADSSGTMQAEFTVRELFVDANIARHVYFRAGKQVLQWGRCFFWNPTDLINVERKPFIDKIGYREGALGLRMHVPFGTRANLYGFADLHDLRSIDSLAGAGKAEVLLGGVEMALSAWGKRGHKPVIGFDMSFPLFGAVGSLEASATDGANYPTVAVDRDGYLAIKDRSGTWYPRIALGILAILDFLGVDDRLNLGAEFYFNGAAHSSTLLTDTRRYPLRPAFPGDTTVVELNKGEFFFAQGLYEENSNAMGYAALFSSVKDFIVSDLTLDINAIVNVNDWSAVTTAALTYTTLHNLSVGLSLNAFFGPDRAEYTLRGDGLVGRLSVGLLF